MLYYENKARKKGFRTIIGVDEAGRGPLAGPVVAAAVSLKDKNFNSRIDDSKVITHRQRQEAFHEIFDKAYVGVGIISETVIDTVNILEATYLAMARAVDRLIDQLPTSEIADNAQETFLKRTCLLIDGPSFKTHLPFHYQTIVNGDALSLSIACASIVAKVTRDRILETYDRVFPQYGFRNHKGYPTRAHKLAIQQHGLSLIHRQTFESFVLRAKVLL